jgi:two-component system, sensor histidine kinase
LELIAGGARLADILANICDAIDAQDPGMMSTVLLMDPDGKRLWPGGAPPVPAGLVWAIPPL